MLEQALQWLKANSQVQRFDVDGRSVFSHKVFLPPESPQCEPLQLTTLQSVVDLCKHLVAQEKPPVIQVVGPVLVRVLGDLDAPSQTRQVFGVVGPALFSSGYSIYSSQRDFLNSLKTGFVNTSELSDLITLVGNVKHVSDANYKDDGISQSAKVATSLIQESDEPLRAEWALAPYRTFLEVEQPVSSFLLWARVTENRGVEFRLFESDGGKWKLDAIASIREFLQAKLPDATILA